MSSRDLVAFHPMERVDLPDFRAAQQNSRSDTRAALNSFLFGGSAELSKILGGFSVTASSPADTLVHISAGTAFGSEVLPDGSVEFGVEFGEDTDDQTYDFDPLANNTYNIYIRFRHSLGSTGNRVFRSESAEVVQAVDTRAIVGWDVTAATSSPGDGWFKIAEVVWGGATVVTGNITKTRFMYFEGNEDDAFDITAEWGDVANDRNADRGTYGITNLYTWVRAVERRLAEIHDSTLNTAWYGDDGGSGGLVPGELRQNRYTVAGVDDHWSEEGLFAGNGVFEVDTAAGSIKLPGGNSEFSSVVTRTVSIPGDAFMPFDATQLESTAGLVITTTYNGDATAIARVGLAAYVPHGAQVTNIEMVYQINDTDGDPKLVVSLNHHPIDSLTGAVVASQDGATNDAAVHTATLVANTIVDYVNRIYTVSVTFDPDNDSNAGELGLWGVKITYQTARLFDDGTGF